MSSTTIAQTDRINRRILVVDDNESIHADMRKTLQPRRSVDELSELESLIFSDTNSKPAEPLFEIESAYQGQEGCDLVSVAETSGRPYSLAIVDMQMPPGWDGLETIPHLWAASPTLQILICTAFSKYTWEEIVERLGPSDQLLILKKPFDVDEFRQVVDAMTRRWSKEIPRTYHIRQDVSSHQDVSSVAQSPQREFSDPADLLPGMVLARDVLSANGLLLAPVGQPVTARLIHRLSVIADKAGLDGVIKVNPYG